MILGMMNGMLKDIMKREVKESLLDLKKLKKISMKNNKSLKSIKISIIPLEKKPIREH